MIPKILHRMWIDKKIKDNDGPPSRYNIFTRTFDEHNPDFEIYFWNYNKIIDMFENNPNLQYYYNVWKNLKHHIQKCDFARFIILYLYGGIYVDLDFVCFKNLSPLLDRELLLVMEPPEHSIIYNDPFDARLYNGFIGSIPKHPFWIDWLNYIIKSLETTDEVMETTGPVNFRKFFDQSQYTDIPLVDTCDILPIYFDDGKHYITKQCVNKNNFSNKVSDDYNNRLNNYVHTKWSEGSNWGEEAIESFAIIEKNNNKKKVCCTFLIFIIILLLAIIIYIIIKKIDISSH